MESTKAYRSFCVSSNKSIISSYNEGTVACVGVMYRSYLSVGVRSLESHDALRDGGEDVGRQLQIGQRCVMSSSGAHQVVL